MTEPIERGLSVDNRIKLFIDDVRIEYHEFDLAITSRTSFLEEPPIKGCIVLADGTALNVSTAKYRFVASIPSERNVDVNTCTLDDLFAATLDELRLYVG